MPSFSDASYEQWITSGSDNRLLPGVDGLNPYGCSPQVRDVLSLGSCTCSSPSPRGVAAAEALLRRFEQSDRPQLENRRVVEEHRRQLARLLQLPREVEIAFTPSGTDVELLALALVAGTQRRPVVNIVVGPTEVGSGTPRAAAGCHYDSLLPRGDVAVPGGPVSEELADRVTVKRVEIRDSGGGMLPEFEIDSVVTEVAVEGAASGARVLLHLVAHSKTGMHAPSLACVDRLRRHLGDDVAVVIDAAQGRVSRRGLGDVLGRGHLVIFTGSKFYGGPPFSGALLVPPNWQPSRRGIERLPGGFDAYFTSAEMPEAWRGIRHQLGGWENYGATMRWAAALAEIDAYYQVSDADRLAILRDFEKAVPELLKDSSPLRLLPVFPPVEDDHQTRLLESKTTVFGFRVFVEGRPLGRDELKQLHRELNRDLRGEPFAGPLATLARRFHIGQPVPFRDGSAALRIALGGEMIVRVATDRSLGDSLEQRQRWLRDRLAELREKLEILVAARSPQASAKRASIVAAAKR